MEEQMNGIYRHHKGALYVVLGLARYSNNGPNEGDKMVLYYSLEKKHLCVREIGQFNERVRWPDGIMRERFCSLETAP